MVEVEGGQEFEAWFLTLAEKDAEASLAWLVFWRKRARRSVFLYQ